MSITTRVISERPDYTRVGFYDKGQLMGSINFPTRDYHDKWDAFVDKIISTPTPPGLPEPS